MLEYLSAIDWANLWPQIVHNGLVALCGLLTPLLCRWAITPAGRFVGRGIVWLAHTALRVIPRRKPDPELVALAFTMRQVANAQKVQTAALQSIAAELCGPDKR